MELSPISASAHPRCMVPQAVMVAVRYPLLNGKDPPIEKSLIELSQLTFHALLACCASSHNPFEHQFHRVRRLLGGWYASSLRVPNFLGRSRGPGDISCPAPLTPGPPHSSRRSRCSCLKRVLPTTYPCSDKSLIAFAGN